jgi:hypothetical protein
VRVQGVSELQGQGCVGIRVAPLQPSTMEMQEARWEITVICGHEHMYALRLCNQGCMGLYESYRDGLPDQLTCKDCAEVGVTTVLHIRERALTHGDA